MTAPLQVPPARTTRENSVGYAALALGILALITSVLLVGLLFGSLAVTLGLAGLDAVTDNEATNRKSAIAAVVLGVVAIVISLAALVFRIWLIV
ncbi:hypothetical protein [Mycobacterium sp.]|jgi:hypothetical protein|uniref:hypothetical protein n=1 Tax=Mycobacterium sp. TaxID=1785 RepID=UPI0028BBB3EB|nr:hypothetical protein [Mycobacterium sp.]MDT5059315.1 hypothetical protein [Mycobacterium sp.]